MPYHGESDGHGQDGQDTAQGPPLSAPLVHDRGAVTQEEGVGDSWDDAAHWSHWTRKPCRGWGWEPKGEKGWGDKDLLRPRLHACRCLPLRNSVALLSSKM